MIIDIPTMWAILAIMAVVVSVSVVNARLGGRIRNLERRLDSLEHSRLSPPG
jgi:hypothetical protein